MASKNEWKTDNSMSVTGPEPNNLGVWVGHATD